jgi:hypothetical protein
MTRYAENTGVPVDRSRAEIERTLSRYGAHAFGYATENNRAMISFKMKNRMVRFVLSLPPIEDYRKTPGRGRERFDSDTYRNWEQACRQCWRALSLVIKAKLEAVESRISTLEEEFLAFLVLPDGKTVGQFMVPQVEAAYTTGRMPKMLPEYAEPGGNRGV